MESVTLFGNAFRNEERNTACRDPLLGHEVTKEYRTKMADWMIEVTTSFKCAQRTYFLAMAIFDKYFIANH